MLNITITEQTPDNMLRAIRAACNELLGDNHADLTTQAAQHNSRAEELRVASERELDKSAARLSRYGQGGPLNVDKLYPVGEQEAQQMVQGFREAHPQVAAAGLPPLGPAVYGGAITGTGTIETPPQNIPKLEPTPAVEMDSSGAEWNPELHASTKAKNQDGTWKKRRGAASLVAQSDSAAEQATQAVADAIAANPGATLVHDEVQVPALPPLPPAPPAAPLVRMNDIYAQVTAGKVLLNNVIAAAQAMGFADVGAFSRDATPEQRAQLLAQLTKEAA